MKSFVFDAIVAILLYSPIAILAGLAWWCSHKGWKVAGGIFFVLAVLATLILVIL